MLRNARFYATLVFFCIIILFSGVLVLKHFQVNIDKEYQPKFKGFLTKKISYEPNFNTYEEEMAMAIENSLIDSLYEVEIIRIISPTEAKKLQIFDKVPIPEYSIFYECLIKYDYLNEVEVNKYIYLREFGSFPWQLPGQPPYKPNTQLIGFLSNTNSEIVHFVVTRFVKSNDEYLYSTETRETDLAHMSIEMSEEESSVVTTNKENPIRFVYKFKYDEMLNFLITDAKEHDAYIKKEKSEFEILINTDRSAFNMAKPDQVSDKLPEKIDAELTSLSFISEEEKISKDLIELLLLAHEKPETFAASDIKVYDVGVSVIGELRDKVISNIPFLNSINNIDEIELYIPKHSLWIMYEDDNVGYFYSFSPKGSVTKSVSYKDYKNTYVITNRNNITLQKINSAYHVRKESLKTRLIIYYIVLPLSLWLIIGAIIIYVKRANKA